MPQRDSRVPRRKFYGFAISAAVAVALVAGCGGGGGGVSGSAGGSGAVGNLLGTVVDANNSPVSNATVSVNGVPSVTPAVTGNDGQFFLNNVPVGSQTIKASTAAGLSGSLTVTVQDVSVTQVRQNIGNITVSATGGGGGGGGGGTGGDSPPPPPQFN